MLEFAALVVFGVVAFGLLIAAVIVLPLMLVAGVLKFLFFVIVLPFLGVLIYLIVHGDDMQERSMNRAMSQQEAQAAYIQDVAGSGSTADELEKLKGLHDRGVLSDDEFAAQKQKVLAT